MKQASPFRKSISFAVVAGVFLSVSACSLPRKPVPLERLHEARLLGFPDVRSWGDRYGAHFHTDLVESVRQEEDYFSLNPEGYRTYNALALSGGGPNRAFGAGFMYGWKKAGTRPEFKIVTGISAGALMAPFVFAGPEYEQILGLGLFTTMGTMDLLGLTGPISPLWSESLAEAVPFARQRRGCPGSADSDKAQNLLPKQRLRQLLGASLSGMRFCQPVVRLTLLRPSR